MTKGQPVIIPSGNRYADLDTLIERHKRDILDEIREPVEGDSPFVDFWALIRGAAEMDVRSSKNDEYFAAGYCGGCETCGNAPWPGVPLHPSGLVRAKMAFLLTQMDRWDMRTKAQMKLERKAAIAKARDGR